MPIKVCQHEHFVICYDSDVVYECPIDYLERDIWALEKMIDELEARAENLDRDIKKDQARS